MQQPATASLFFFSSRRRHTRWNCDWSSDVCSSDLETGSWELNIFGEVKSPLSLNFDQLRRFPGRSVQIGRASSRERVEASVGGVRVRKNATSLYSRFKSLDTLKVIINSVTLSRVIS